MMVRLAERGERARHFVLNVIDADERASRPGSDLRAACDPRHDRNRNLDVRDVAQVEQLREAGVVGRI